MTERSPLWGGFHCFCPSPPPILPLGPERTQSAVIRREGSTSQMNEHTGCSPADSPMQGCPADPPAPPPAGCA